MVETNTQPENLQWAIIGGGNGGQSLAGHLALMGFVVRLYDIIPETVEAIQNQGGVQVTGVVEGFGQLSLVTDDIKAAISGADIVMVVAPAIAHCVIAKACAPFLSDDQLIFIHPGATGGALEFRKILDDEKCKADVTLAEANSLLYACRSHRPGQAEIFGIKKELMAAALPANQTHRAVKRLNEAFPQIHAGTNVLETSLGNPNALMHPAPTLLNASMVESDREWLYYWDGITPSIGAFVEMLDRERLAVAERYGITLLPIRDWYEQAYNVTGKTLSEIVKSNDAYAKVKGQKTLHTRYLLEDIPAGLVPMISLGKIAHVDVSKMEAVVKLAECLIGKDLTSGGRTLEALGLEGKNVDEILHFVNEGT